MKIGYLGLIIGLTLVGFVHAGSLWEKTKEIAGSAVDTASEVASDVGKAVSGEDETPEVRRSKIDKMADATLQRLLREAPQAVEQFDSAAGYAVFDTRRLSLLITTEFGQGVAVNRGSGKRIYMQMATGGVNVGYGAQLYQIVFLFPSASAFDKFVTKGWDAGAAADAVGGKDAGSAAVRLPDGTHVYKLSEKGLMLSAALTGTRYWPSDELNQAVE